MIGQKKYEQGWNAKFPPTRVEVDLEYDHSKTSGWNSRSSRSKRKRKSYRSTTAEEKKEKP